MVDRPVQHNHGGMYRANEVDHLRDMLYPNRRANRMMSDLCVSRLDFDPDSIGLKPEEFFSKNHMNLDWFLFIIFHGM
jgi:hypothetical protein